MKRLTGRIILFLIPLLVLLMLIDLASLTDRGDALLSRIFMSESYRHVGTLQVSPAIKTAQAESAHTKLILGDSVCNQVFIDYRDQNDDYLLLPTNVAVTLDGQYILTRLFLESHPDATDIYLIMLPGSFRGRYDSSQSYSYLIEPFGRPGLLTYLSEDTIRGMKSHYGSLFLTKNVIRFLDGSSINNKLYLYYLQSHKAAAPTEDIISDEAAYYLNEIQSICDEHGVTFHLLPAPVCDSDENADRIDRLKTAAEDLNLSPVFDEYFDCITLYPEDMFPDGDHFGPEYAVHDTFSDCIETLQEKSGDLQGLIIDQDE